MARIMGLDLGTKTIGVAVSDELFWTAQGLEVIRRKNLQTDIGRLREIMSQYSVTEIVLGLPKNMDGTLGDRGIDTTQFSEILEEHLNVPVHLWDERLTTVSAEKTLLEADMSRKKRKQVIDQIAASLILQTYLDSKRMR